jgi:hypothetical protein
MEKLSRILWQERALLDTLLFRLEEERLVVAGGLTRWVGQAAHEVESTLATIRSHELLRAVVTDEIASWVGLRSGAALEQLAARVDEPWRGILLDHHDAIAAAMTEIAALAQLLPGEAGPAEPAPLERHLRACDADEAVLSAAAVDYGRHRAGEHHALGHGWAPRLTDLLG